MSLAADDVSLYDRQIRTWGLDAQKRLMAASVLVCGFGGLAAEVCKNIVLAGVRSITIVDDAVVSEADLHAQYFFARGDVGKLRAEAGRERLQALNPNVTVRVDTDALTSKAPAFFHQFQVVCLTDSPLAVQLQVDAACRAAPGGATTPLLCGEVLGFYAYMFEDLGVHQYLETKVDPRDKSETKETKSAEFVDLQTLVQGITAKGVVKKFRRRSKPLGQALLAIVLLLKYRDEFGQFPAKDDDAALQRLKQMRDKAAASDELDAATTLPDATLERVMASASVGACMANVCAVLGGTMGQEVLKVISQKDAPLVNSVVYDAVQGLCIEKPFGL